MAEYVVISRVKDYVKKKGLNSSGDLAKGLDKKMRGILDEAAKRTKANKRKTMRSDDL